MLDLGGIDVFTACNDHVLGPVDDIIEAFWIAKGDISGAVPAIIKDSAGLRCFPPISHGNGWGTHQKLAGLPVSDVIAAQVNDAERDQRQGSAARFELA